MDWNKATEQLTALHDRQLGDAWAAGFFDGEGTVTGRKKSKGGVIEVKLSAVQVDPRPIHLLIEMYGGSAQVVKRGNENWQDCVVWQRTGAKSVNDILERWLPFLQVKREQAEIARLMAQRILDYRGLSRAYASQGLDDEERQARMDLVEAMKKVKAGQPVELPAPIDLDAKAVEWAQTSGTFELLPATAAEVAEGLGLSLQAAHLRLGRLADRGILTKTKSGQSYIYAKPTKARTR